MNVGARALSGLAAMVIAGACLMVWLVSGLMIDRAVLTGAAGCGAGFGFMLWALLQ